jgi:hypothetical protein
LEGKRRIEGRATRLYIEKSEFKRLDNGERWVKETDKKL